MSVVPMDLYWIRRWERRGRYEGASWVLVNFALQEEGSQANRGGRGGGEGNLWLGERVLLDRVWPWSGLVRQGLCVEGVAEEVVYRWASTRGSRSKTLAVPLFTLSLSECLISPSHSFQLPRRGSIFFFRRRSKTTAPKDTARKELTELLAVASPLTVLTTVKTTASVCQKVTMGLLPTASQTMGVS